VITLPLPAAGGARPYYLGAGLLGALESVLAAHLAGRRALVVSDETVARLHAGAVAARVGASLLALPAGEEHKTPAAAERVARWLLAQGAERGDLVVAVGGGVVTDLAGFAASITLRGLPWVAVPTTLLGMVDAAVGGKTGVDLDVGKNLLGTFWQPEAVLADPAVLATLDRRQLRSGLVEVVKAAIIAPATLCEPFDRHGAALAAGDLPGAEELIAAAVAVKAEIVGADEREAGLRAALNLGHTVGHALEAATGYRRFLHGEAVAWGLLAALAIARRRGVIDAVSARAWVRRLISVVEPPPAGDLEWGRLAPFIARDKKARSGRVGWVLPREGGVDIGIAVPEDEAAAAWTAVLRAASSSDLAELF